MLFKFGHLTISTFSTRGRCLGRRNLFLNPFNSSPNIKRKVSGINKSGQKYRVFNESNQSCFIGVPEFKMAP